MNKEWENQEILERIEKLSKEIQSSDNNLNLLHSRAQLYTKIQEHSKAINDYITILQSNPSDKESQVKLEMLQTIVKFTNTNIYASTNTNMDPWLE
ncbi:MAG: tetratricopeptide repeat protein [Bacteroidetes bacterium]|nr:tetratricopeptide repeat protein [Bacteroidota bacterium]MBL6944021.1 tetratricopeptide repeat protein [Bacteroidales bacterium]